MLSHMRSLKACKERSCKPNTPGSSDTALQNFLVWIKTHPHSCSPKSQIKGGNSRPLRLGIPLANQRKTSLKMEEEASLTETLIYPDPRVKVSRGVKATSLQEYELTVCVLRLWIHIGSSI